MSKPAWSWADYERCKLAEERKAARAARPVIVDRPLTAKGVDDQHRPRDDKQRIAPLQNALAGLDTKPRDKIDITRAPSLMERQAEDWAAAAKPLAIRPAPAPPRNQVLCRCGSRFGKGSGFVPSWFGDKCIEGDCPLRGIARRKAA